MSGNEDELPPGDGATDPDQDGGGGGGGDGQDGAEGDGEGSDGSAEPRLNETAARLVDPTLPRVESGSVGGTYEVAGIALPGLYDIEQSGAGVKTQYLTETEAGGFSQDTSGGEGTQGESGSESGSESSTASESASTSGSSQPPMQLTLRAKLAADTFDQLVGLRRRKEVFGVTIGPISLDRMELVDLQRRVTGERPYAYDATIKVQEYREYELRTNLSPAPAGATTGPGSISGLGPGGPTLDWIGQEPTGVPSTAVDITAQGADNTGGSPINSALQSATSDGTTVYFPPGEYLVNPISVSGSNWEWVGHDATIFPPSGHEGTWLSFSGSGWHVRNFVAENRGGSSPKIRPTGSNWRMTNWYSKGSVNHHGIGGNGNAAAYMLPGVSGGTGVLDNVLTPDGSSSAGSSNRTGLFIMGGGGHLVAHRNLWSQWGQNTFYAESYSGPLTISNSVFHNTNVGVRVGGDTTIRNCRFISDGDFPGQRWTGGAKVQRGIWIAQNSPKSGDLTITGCDFKMVGPHASTAIVEGGGGLSGSVTIEDTRIEGTGVQLSSALQASGLHVTGAGVSAGGGSISNSCVTGGVSGVSGSVTSSGCARPDVSGSFGGGGSLGDALDEPPP